MKQQPRSELKFQDHILDSYELRGGFGRKWATTWQVGRPDLIVTLPLIGLHLAEAKHRPEFGVTVHEMPSPLDAIQVRIAKDYLKGGAIVYLFVVGGGAKTAVGAALYLFDPRDTTIVAKRAPQVRYEPSTKFDVRHLIQQKMEKRCAYTT